MSIVSLYMKGVVVTLCNSRLPRGVRGLDCRRFKHYVKSHIMIHISEQDIRFLLNWDDTFDATETAIRAVSEGKAQLSPRTFTSIFDSAKWMTTMPGYLEDKKYGGWACKILSCNPENEKGPNPVSPHNANIILMDENTGALKAVLTGLEITDWRTAAASAVATEHLHRLAEKPQNVLAIFGCGNQGRAHAKCFHHHFDFNEIRLWNRTTQRAINLARELNVEFGVNKFKAFDDTEKCARGADVIVTTTTPEFAPLIKYKWLKQGVHINAVGVPVTDEQIFELDEETYKNAVVYVDSWSGAHTELKRLKEFGTNMKAELGDVILEKSPTPNEQELTVFQSLGMAVEDCAMARLIYDKYLLKLDKPK